MSRKNRYRLQKRNYRQIIQNKEHKSKIVALKETSVEYEAGKEVFVYQSELDYLSRCILDYPSIETGGQLFGFYSSKGTPVVCYAIGPGHKANHRVTFFNQDIDYLQTVGNILTREYGLQHIGEWHSHHQLGLNHPSGHDAHTMHHSVDALHLGQFLLCIGTISGQSANVNAFTFYENDRAYYPTAWSIKAEPSPFRQVVDERLKDLLIHPSTSEPRLAGMHISRISIAKDADTDYLLRAYHLNIPSV